MQLAERNAASSFVTRRNRREDSEAALARLQQRLSLSKLPRVIECFDVSHIQGSDYVGSMVVVEDGLPKKSDYRRFKIKTVAGNDDFAAMEEVLTRRFTAYLEDVALTVHAQHHLRSTLPIHREELLQHDHHKIHRRIVIIQ